MSKNRLVVKGSNLRQLCVLLSKVIGSSYIALNSNLVFIDCQVEILGAKDSLMGSKLEGKSKVNFDPVKTLQVKYFLHLNLVLIHFRCKLHAELGIGKLIDNIEDSTIS